MVTIINGVLQCVTLGSTAQLVCNNGYTPGEDSNDRMCMSDGNWSGGTQTCVRVSSIDDFDLCKTT